MNSQVELFSLSISKTSKTIESFQKYSVEANIDEIENGENHSLFNYAFTILSEPKNIRISVEGTAKVMGNQEERDKVIEKNENNIPKILPIVYQELFPIFFTLSKSANVPCPPYQILAFGSETQPNERKDVSETESISKQSEPNNEDVSIENHDEKLTEDGNEANLEELKELYQKTTEKYNENPTEENKQELEKISEQLSKIQQKETIESSV